MVRGRTYRGSYLTVLSMQRTLRIVSLAFLCLVFLLPPAARAVTSFTIENIGGQVGLGTSDLKLSIVHIIQWALGILVLVAVVMVIVGGMTWLTSAGNDEQVDKAKKIISAAVIGMVVVLLSWAVVIFVAGTTANVTGA